MVLSAKVEKLVPGIAVMFQMLLNSGNAVMKQISELEAAQEIAMLSNVSGSINEAMNAVAASNPACLQYLDSIANYVRLYGGGDGHPLISFLDEFSKTYGGSVSLGEDMMRQISYLDFQEPSCQFPLLRAGLVACQLTSPLVRDGVSKLLSKSDLDKLKASSNRANIIRAEDILNDAWKILLHCKDKPELKVSFGRLLVRTILFLTGKEKSGREGKSYKDLNEICGMFTADVSTQSQQSSSSSNPASSSDKPANLLALSAGEQALLQNKHLKKMEKLHGCILYCLMLLLHFWLLQGYQLRYMHPEHADKVFIFHGLAGDCGKFVYKGLFGGEDTICAPVDEFKKWRVTKAAIPVLCEEALATKHTFGHSPLLLEAEKKSEAEHLLFQIYSENSHDANDLLYCLPTNVYSKSKVNVGKMRLFPLGTLTKIKDGKKAAILIEYSGRQYSLSPFTSLKDFSEKLGFRSFCLVKNSCSTCPWKQLRDSKQESQCLIPFHWVKSSSDEDAVTMELVYKEFHGIKLPHFRNSCKLAPQTLLVQKSKELLDGTKSSSSKKRKSST